jgi:peptidyl-prolyl cis-trans isomerase A (cyclophilin A)
MRCALVALVVLVVAGCGGSASSSSGPPDALLKPNTLTAKSPSTYDATFDTSAGTFVVHVRRAWAPHGADRFYNLVRNGFFDGERIFRVVPHFVVQFGISGYPEVSSAWESATIPDDPVRAHNARGAVTFATSGPNTRTTQIFVNLGANQALDAQGFAPFGTVTKGMSVVDGLYSGYGDAPTPHQGEMAAQGNAYFEKAWPKLDTIRSGRIAGG